MADLIASDRHSFVVDIDQAVYSLTSVKKACYALMQFMSCQLSVDGDKIVIKSYPVADCAKGPEELEALLLDELLDYSLREIISEKTDPTRNLILSNAFSNTKLVG